MRIRKNGKVIRLTESDLRRITKKVLREQSSGSDKKQITDFNEIKNMIDKNFNLTRTYINTIPKEIIKEFISQRFSQLKKDNVYYNNIQNFINDISKNWVKGKTIELKLNINGKENVLLTFKPDPRARQSRGNQSKEDRPGGGAYVTR